MTIGKIGDSGDSRSRPVNHVLSQKKSLGPVCMIQNGRDSCCMYVNSPKHPRKKKSKAITAATRLPYSCQPYGQVSPPKPTVI